jgi:hypothetical protein
MLLALACNEHEPPPEVQAEPGVSLQRVRGATTAANAFVGVDLLVTDATGRPVPCDVGSWDLNVSVSYAGAPPVPVDASDLQLQCGPQRSRDVALVLDESGSQSDALEQTRQGARELADAVLASGGRVGVVHVSSTAEVATQMTSDADAVHAAIDGLTDTNGWTALYDGIRRGNELLGLQRHTSAASRPADLRTFCDDAPEHAVVVYTNGEDNNSADERTLASRGDGIDTTPSDLVALAVGDVATPLYTIGLGPRVDHPVLEHLSATTGGQHLAVAGPDAVPDAFELVAAYPDATTAVCATLDARGCGIADVHVQYQHELDGVVQTGQQHFAVHVPCPTVPSRGRSATVLMQLTDPSLDPDAVDTLVRNAVDWVSPVPRPRVLLVRDDNHHDEALADLGRIEGILTAARVDLTTLEEPPDGLELADLRGYHVVWFSNPRWPVDDAASVGAMQQFLGEGGGLVLQGDDVSWAASHAFSMADLTHLDHLSNGTSTCGVRTDNGRGANYAVTALDEPHPVLAGLEGAVLSYGDDLDHTSPRNEGEVVLAWATLEGDPSCPTRVPAIVVSEGLQPDQSSTCDGDCEALEEVLEEVCQGAGCPDPCVDPTPTARLWIADNTGRLGVWDPLTDTTTLGAQLDTVLTDLSFHPDGRLFGVDWVGDLREVDPATGATSVSVATGGYANGLVFDEQGVAYVSGGGHTRTVDLVSGRITTLVDSYTASSSGDLTFAGGDLFMTGFGPSGTALYSVDASAGLYDVAVPFPYAAAYGASTTPDGRIYGVSGDTVSDIDLPTASTTPSGTVIGMSAAYGMAFFGESCQAQSP